MMVHYVLIEEDLVKDSNFCGWDSLVIINPFLTPQWFQKIDVIPDWVLMQNQWSLYLPTSFKPRCREPSWKWSHGPSWLTKHGFLRAAFVSLWSCFLLGDRDSSFFSGMNGALWMKGKGSSAQWRVALRNQVWWHVSQDWTWCVPVWGMEGPETQSEGLGGEVLGKNSEVLALASAQPVVLLSVLLSPPVKWK